MRKPGAPGYGGVRGGSAAAAPVTIGRSDFEQGTSDSLCGSDNAPCHWWPVGLTNVGNTCYANAAIQCLLSTSLAKALLNPKVAAVLRRYSSNPTILSLGSGSVDSDEDDIMDDPNRMRRRMSRVERKKRLREERRMHKTCLWLTKELKAITREYANAQHDSSSGSSIKLLSWLNTSSILGQPVVNPGNITRNPHQLSPCLRAYRQEDAHEFLRALISTLVMNGHNKQLSSLFDGLLESAVTCQTCRRSSLTRDRYMDLSLDIHGSHINSLKEALEEFTKTEVLSGDNKVFCQKCNVKRSATKGLRLATAPSILLCHLKRFAFNAYGNLVRLHKRVKFPMRLEIADFMSRVNKARPPPYELVGVLVHQGRTCDSGHYVAFVKCNGAWFKCNDSVVTKVETSTVLRQQAYILVYEVEEMRKKHGVKHTDHAEEHNRRKARIKAERLRKTTMMSLLCGVDVLSEHPFLSDLCCEGTAVAKVVRDDGSTVDGLVSYPRDDITVGESTVASSTCDTTTSVPPFRKSASSGNLPHLEDEPATGFYNVEKPQRKSRKDSRPEVSDRPELPHSFSFSKSDAGNKEGIQDQYKVSHMKWDSERPSKHSWRYRERPPLPASPKRRSSSAVPATVNAYK